MFASVEGFEEDVRPQQGASSGQRVPGPHLAPAAAKTVDVRAATASAAASVCRKTMVAVVLP
jgi:hypothetical protein